MRKKRRQYTKEFKIEAVRLIVEEGRRISEVARGLGISENLLHRWNKKYEEGKIEPFPGKGRLSPEDEELRQLRRENKRLRMERDILKKAVASSTDRCNTFLKFISGSLIPQYFSWPLIKPFSDPV